MQAKGLPTPGVTPATVVPSAVPESTAPKTPEVPDLPEVPTELTVCSRYLQPVWLAVQNLSRSSYVIRHCLVKQQPARGAQTRSARTPLSLPHHGSNVCVRFSVRKAASSASSRLDVPSMVCTRLHTLGRPRTAQPARSIFSLHPSPTHCSTAHVALKLVPYPVSDGQCSQTLFPARRLAS